MHTQRNISLDILRIIACVGVITIHSSGSILFHRLVERGSLWFNESIVIDALFRWSVPVFAMLTGFFMLDPAKDMPIKKLFSRYILRIVVALVVWSLFYALTLHKDYYPFGIQEGHFWYLEMLISLYLSLPVLRLVARRKEILKYCCLVWLAFMCYIFLGSFITLPFQLQDIILPRFAGYCLMAYYIKLSFSDKGKHKSIVSAIYVLGVIGLLLTIFAGIETKNPDTVMFSYDAPNVIITALAIFLWFVRSTAFCNIHASSIVEECSRCTFGIYLIHLWVLTKIFFRIHRFVPHPIPLVILCVGITFCSSFFIAWGIRRIPHLNRYLV